MSAHQRQRTTDPAALPIFDTEQPLANGYTLVEAVNPDGNTSFWLVSPSEVDDLGCACTDCAPHEGLGRLDANVQSRI